MTISSTTRIAGPFVGNGVTTTFPFTYKVFQVSDVQVVRLTIATGSETTLTIVTDYGITLNSDQDSNPGGNIVLVAPLAATYTLTGTSDIANLQPTDLTNQGGFYPEVITDALDRATIQIQQLADQTDRSIKIPISDGVLDMTTPGTTDRASKFLAFDANGRPTASSGTGSDIGLREDLADATVSFAGSRLVGFRQSGTGATARTVDAKLKDTVSVKDFGAVGDGVADDTVALKAAFDSAIPLKVAVELFGTYKVSGPVTTTSSIASGGLHIICRGDVGVNVDAASTAFAKLFNIYTNNASEFNNVSITGGSLTVNLNNKCGIGFYLRRIESTPFQSSPIGGTINIESPVTILNAKDATAAVNGESAGFQVFGNYRSVYINSPTVIGVERLTSGGTCVGIGVGYCGGEVTIFRPYIKNVLHSTQNADGINVAGLHGDPITPPLESWGKCVVTEPTFVDCQGRSFKSQFSNTVVTNPHVYRQSVVSIASGNDFDFQRGNGILDTPTFEYRLNGATSPLGASFSPIVFQQVLSDTNMAAICRGALLKTEVPMNQFCLLVVDGTSDSSSTEVSGLTVVPLGSFATTAIVNCVVNLPNAVNLVSMPGIARISIHDLYGPISCAMLGYTGYTSGSVASKLVLEVYNTRTTIAATASNGYMYPLSGNKIQGIDSVFVHSNQGSLVSIWNYGGPPNTFDFATMTVGTVVVLDLSSVITVANAPPWGTVFALSEKAVAECLAERSSGTRYIRATLMSGVAPFQTKVFLSSDSGATWFTESESPPRTITADYALAGSDKTLISNKSGSTCVLTLPTASTVTGRHITIKNTQAQLVTSASANVVPITGGAAGTAILAATSGVWATIVSDGTNWITMSN